jgi:tryptophanyl-tRNA synthetase
MFPDRVLSGMRPTGSLHLGHYHGVLKNWVRLQEAHPCLFFVADWHALTTHYEEPGIIERNTWDMVIDWLASGVDPAKATLFIQSHVQEHAELHLLLSMVTPLGWLERVPSYKEQQQQIAEKDLGTYGFLGYPLLQTADIIIYKANAVPVGEDQAPHIELTREVVRRFNHLYGDVFPEPLTLLTPTPRVPGTDGRKMSKSYGNAVFLKDPPATLREKLKPMITDPARKRRSDPGTPEICPVFDLHKAFSSEETRAWAADGCRSAGIGCLDCKGRLMDHLLHRLEEIHARRPEFASRPDTVWDVLREGSRRARETARATMEEVRAAMKVDYRGVLG